MKWFNFSVGIIAGSVLTLVFVFSALYFYESKGSKFIALQISNQEQISTEAFNHYPEKTSNFIQIHYMQFFWQAKDIGLVSELEYHRATTFANTRLCINYENTDETKRAELFCKWSKFHLSQWRSDIDFKTFKQKLIDARDKKEPPDF